MQRDILEKRLHAIEILPGLRKSVLDLENALNDPESGINEIAAIVEKDVSFSAAVLKTANSVLFGVGGRRISTIQEAVGRIGLQEVHRVCVTTGIMNNFSRDEIGLDLREFWLHSLCVSNLCRNMLHFFPGSNLKQANTAFLVGLVHDIGMLAMDHLIPNEYKEMLREQSEQGGEINLELEREIFGMDHAEAGSILLSGWNFPEEIIQSLKYHHEPHHVDPKYKTLTKCLYLSDFQACAAGAPAPGEGIADSEHLSYWTDLNLSDEDLAKLVHEGEEIFEINKEFLNIWIQK